MKKFFRKIDFPLTLAVIIFAVFGLIMIFSASNVASRLQYSQPEYFFAKKQLFALILGSVASLVVLFISPKTYNFFSKILLIGIIAILVLLKSYGVVSNNAQSWFNIFGFSIQPSEFAKSAIILYLACWYGSRKKYDKWWEIFLPIVPCVIIFFLIAAEPDLGTALIIFFMVLLIFFVIPFKGFKYLRLMKIGIIGSLILVATLISLFPNILTSSQQSRLTFKNPCDRYLEETGYQVCNGYIAMNNGGVLGVGLGNSTQKYLYLPEAYTDMIFPIIVEELGLVTGAIILIGYLFILYRILTIAKNAVDLKGSIIAFGTFAYILVHIVVNLGGVLGLIPITGVPLPFLSYGGTYTLNLLIMVALTNRVSYETKTSRNKKEIDRLVQS